MNKNKILNCILVGAIVLSLIGCGWLPGGQEDDHDKRFSAQVITLEELTCDNGELSNHALREKTDITALFSKYEGVKSFRTAWELFKGAMYGDIRNTFSTEDFIANVEEGISNGDIMTVNINSDITFTEDSLPSNTPLGNVFYMEEVNICVAPNATLTIQRNMESYYDAYIFVDEGGTLIFDNATFSAYMTNLVVAPGASVYFKNGASYVASKGSIINHGTISIDNAQFQMTGTFYNAKDGSIAVTNQGGLHLETTDSSSNLEIYNYADDDYTPSTHYGNRGNMTFSNSTFSMIYRGDDNLVFEAEPFVNAGTMSLSCSSDTTDLCFNTQGHFQNYGTITLSGESNCYRYISFMDLFENYGTLDVSAVNPLDIYIEGSFLNYDGAEIIGMKELAKTDIYEQRFYNHVMPNR